MLYTNALSPRYPYRRIPTSRYRLTLSVHKFLCSRVHFFDYPNSGIHLPAADPYCLYVSEQYACTDEYDFIRNHLYCSDLRPGTGGGRAPTALRKDTQVGSALFTYAPT